MFDFGAATKLLCFFSFPGVFVGGSEFGLDDARSSYLVLPFSRHDPDCDKHSANMFLPYAYYLDSKYATGKCIQINLRIESILSLHAANSFTSIWGRS